MEDDQSLRDSPESIANSPEVETLIGTQEGAFLGLEQSKRILGEDTNPLDDSTPERTAYNLDRLREAGKQIDANALILQLEPMEVYANLDRLLRAGADPDIIADRMPAEFTGFRIAELKAAGATKIDLDKLTAEMGTDTALIVIDTLRKTGNFSDSLDIAKHLGGNVTGIILPDLHAAAEYGALRRITKEQADDVVRLHFSGLSPADISRRLHINTEAIGKELTARGIIPNKRVA